MRSPSTYIPMDRRQAISRNVTLPTRTKGAALFADISGFTPLTEALLEAYGPKRSSEELTQHLNKIYDALVADVHRYGGSIIAFGGDAITCWFNDDNGLQATVCGLVMQQTINQFSTIEMPSGETIYLAMKAAVAVGPIRRFVVGDPQIQRIDVLAGATLDQMSAAEYHAKKNEVVVGPDVLANIGKRLDISAWRQDPDLRQDFGVVRQIADGSQVKIPQFLSVKPAPIELNNDQIRPWLLPAIYERLKAGKGDFLAELRPVVVLFLSFSGIDYDHDEAAEFKLDAYIRWVQNILAQYGGYLLQLTIGDKGSYMCAAFGTPIAHEDDAIRAVSAALDLVSPPSALGFIDKSQIGISQGQIRAGAYGGTMRRTYGILGDDVNIAARLMEVAEINQILVKDAVCEATANMFEWGKLAPLKVKGKSTLVNAFSVEGVKIQRTVELQQSNYALAMVGRKEELALIEQKIDHAMAGHGQIIGITADAGMGKSRLVAEVGRIVTHRELSVYAGECQSYDRNISYLVWQSIWYSFFKLDPSWDMDKQISKLKQQLKRLDPDLLPRLPLLGAVLNLPIPDNDLTRPFEAKLRKTSLESLLIDCLRQQSKQGPILIVLEDYHWVDPLSHDLLKSIGRAIVDSPIMFILTYRPIQLDNFSLRIDQLLHFTEIQLADFTPQEAEQLISLKIEQLFGAQSDIPPKFIKRITSRAQGNPFYIEELLNYLQDQNFDLYDNEALENLELPTTLHSLILTRIDQLTEQQKSTIKVASVIGRLFAAAWLWGMYPDLGTPEDIKVDLDSLSRLDLIPLDKPEPELTYIFKHGVIQEVAYESLPYAIRARFHGQLAQYLEQRHQAKISRYITLLAFHYGRSNNKNKKREFFRKAGEISQAEYANEAAIDYYEQLLPLISPKEQVVILRKLGQVKQLVGQWDEAHDQFQQALNRAEQLEDRVAQAWCHLDVGDLFRRQGKYPKASTWLTKAQVVFEDLGDQAGLGQALHLAGTLAAQQGELENAQARYEESLIIRRELDDQLKIAALLSNMGIVAYFRGDFDTAITLHEEALSLRYKLGDKWAIANSLNNLSNVYLDQGELLSAQTQLEVAVQVYRQLGDKQDFASALHSLANVNRTQGDYQLSYTHYKESLLILWELGERWLLAYVLEDVGGLAALQKQFERTFRLYGAALALREKLGTPLEVSGQKRLDELLEPARQTLGEKETEAMISAGRAMSLEQAVYEALQFHSSS